MGTLAIIVTILSKPGGNVEKITSTYLTRNYFIICTVL